MSLQKKVILGFFVSAAIIAILSSFLYLNFVEIKKETGFLEQTDTIRSKSLQLRRHEKNYFLYAPEKASEESKAIRQYLDELDESLGGPGAENGGRTAALAGLVREYRSRFENIEKLVATVSRESDSLKKTSPQYLAVSRLIESNFLDKPLEDIRYITEVFSLREDHRLISSLRELDSDIALLRKTGESILFESKELDRAAREKVDGFISASRISILIFFPLFLVVGFGTTAYIIGNVVKRLRMITEVVEKTGTGDFSHVDEPSGSWGNDEVGRLIREFNFMEEQLVLREQELLRSKKLAAIGTLASGVAHELNNPLNNIHTTAQRLLKKTGDDTPDFLRKGLNDIFGQTMRVRNIVGDLLEFACGREPHYLAVELRALLWGVYKNISNTRNLEKMNFELSTDPEEIVIYADSDQLEQIFTNLFTNAVDAVSGEGRLSATAVEDNDTVRITVSDDGRGISAEGLEKIFEPFYTTKDKGTGLGLAIVFNMVKRHNGDIKVESSEGRGTSFIITLPKAPRETAKNTAGQ